MHDEEVRRLRLERGLKLIGSFDTPLEPSLPQAGSAENATNKTGTLCWSIACRLHATFGAGASSARSLLRLAAHGLAAYGLLLAC
eukprot:352917-Chlamydomonas_euryale.AAC.13